MDRDETKEDPFGDIESIIQQSEDLLGDLTEVDLDEDGEKVNEHFKQQAAAQVLLDQQRIRKVGEEVEKGDCNERGLYQVEDIVYSYRQGAYGEKDIHSVGLPIIEQCHLILAREKAMAGETIDAESHIGTLIPAWYEIYKTMAKVLKQPRDKALSPRHREKIAKLQYWNSSFVAIITIARQRDATTYPYRMREAPPIIVYKESSPRSPEDVAQWPYSKPTIRALMWTTTMLAAWLGYTITSIPSRSLRARIQSMKPNKEEMVFAGEITRMMAFVTEYHEHGTPIRGAKSAASYPRRNLSLASQKSMYL